MSENYSQEVVNLLVGNMSENYSQEVVNLLVKTTHRGVSICWLVT